VSVGLRDYCIGKFCPPAVLIEAKPLLFYCFCCFYRKLSAAGHFSTAGTLVSGDPVDKITAKKQRHGISSAARRVK
jgi:hypothetical protein